ncbi:cytochrome c3 family protein [Shewanella yunxiaonensis]|uniref:Cytochrome c3 family protein n=1 Tax=Shewanella yunxiaonensis TaxID=2829809 RepID=A0ABX7YW96_9GAMM|nr:MULTISPECIES: cytochrome c3 family protein [Shewanella]MDF0534311.1 cytochrome c3 family protein [Shewanella sp. A32]QUN07083.1 cytochrome c3 family protein [Shewanella yunxiaonensis]
MSKKLLSALFGASLAALAMSPAAFAADQKINEFHADMGGGCETCHKDGAPSSDGVYEFQQCQSCHGPLADMDAVHKPHDGKLQCNDCHKVHDEVVGQRPTCEGCHDDGRTAEKILGK